MKARYSTRAITEIAGILAYIGERDREAARRIHAYVQRLTSRISEFPEAAEPVAQRRDVYRVPFVKYPYALYYTIDRRKKEVVLLRIIHSARRAPFGR